MKPGDIVVCVASRGYMLTTGKQYTVVRYEPVSHAPTFTWPAYVTVIGDDGKETTGHDHRFKLVTQENAK